MAARALPAVLLLVTLALGPALVAGQMPALESYAQGAVLQDDAAFFYWTINETDKSIHMAVHAKTSGWVAVGISEVGGMVGSDVMLGWVANGTAFMTDRFIFNRSKDAAGVALDEQQDVRIVAGQESYNETTGAVWTTLHFWRPLNTSDCNDRTISPGEHVSVIWAMGTDDEPAYHGLSRGGIELELYPGALFSIYGPDPTTIPKVTAEAKAGRKLSASGWRLPVIRAAVEEQKAVVPAQPKGAAPKFGDGVNLVQTSEWVNATVKGYNVPTDYTTYACNVYDVVLPKKTHTIEFGPILNSTNPETLHHFVIYACLGTDKPNASTNYECTTNPGCSKNYALWAVGGLRVQLPPEAGLPIGPGGYTRFVLQVHYTNPAGLSTIEDHSGMYFRLSPTLRKYDAGWLDLGPLEFTKLIQIPPGQPSWTLDTSCPSECTLGLKNKADAATPNLTVVGSALHMHTTGRQLYTDLYRDGKKLLTVGRQDYYDFAFQQYVNLDPGFYLLPGDELKTRCVWDTTGKTNTTYGGYASNEEMCIHYLLAYPVKAAINGPCFDFCGKQGLLQGKPVDKLPLQSYAVCNDNTMIALPNRTCPTPPDIYGANLPLEVVGGCSGSSATDISQLDASAISVAATPGTQPPATAAQCTAPGANGQTLTYTSCRTLEGGFNLMWNVSSGDGSTPGVSSKTSGGNVTITLRFSGESQGYIAFGLSPTGGMIGTSAIAGWSGANGPEVHLLYLGGFSPALVTEGNMVMATEKSLESTPGANGNSLVIHAAISVPASLASTPQNIVWSKGPVKGNWVSQHLSIDAHKGTLLAIDNTPPPSSGASAAAMSSWMTAGVAVLSGLLCLL